MARRKKMSSLQTGFRSNKISELLGNSKRRSFTSAEISALALGQDLTSNNKFRKSSKRTGLSAGEVSDYYSQGGGALPEQYLTILASVGAEDQPSSAQKTIDGAEVQALIDADIWDDLDIYYNPIRGSGGSENLAKKNWKNPDAHEITTHGTIAFDGLTGWDPNGTTGYLSLNWIPGTDGINYTQNDAGFGVQILENVAETGVNDIGASNNSDGVTNSIFFAARSATDVMVSRINDNASLNVTGITDARGIHQVNRTGASARNVIKDGRQRGSDTQASTTRTTAAVFAGAANGNGTAVRFAERKMGRIWFGKALSLTKTYNLTTIINNSRAALNDIDVEDSFIKLPANMFTWSSGRQFRDPSNIIKWTDGKYYIYASSYTQNASGDSYDSDRIAILRSDKLYGPYSYVSDAWTARPAEWDSALVYSPGAVVANGKVYVFYTGHDGLLTAQGGNIGVIESSDPLGPFTASQAGPVLGNVDDGLDANAITPEEDFRVDEGTPVQMADGSWRLYYKSRDGATPTNRYLSFATTSAANFPLGWTRDPDNPFFSAADTYNLDEPETPSVWRENDIFYMATSATDYENFAIYSSADGKTNWTLLRTITGAEMGSAGSMNGVALYIEDGKCKCLFTHDGAADFNAQSIIGMGRINLIL